MRGSIATRSSGDKSRDRMNRASENKGKGSLSRSARVPKRLGSKSSKSSKRGSHTQRSSTHTPRSEEDDLDIWGGEQGLIEDSADDDLLRMVEAEEGLETTRETRD